MKEKIESKRQELAQIAITDAAWMEATLIYATLPAKPTHGDMIRALAQALVKRTV